MLRRIDYEPYPWAVVDAHLRFSISSHECVTVQSMVRFRCDTTARPSLVLNAHADLHIDKLCLDGVPVDAPRNGEDIIVIPHARDIELQCLTRLDPASNTEREGLFASGDVLATQCEAEGFRRITCYPDRPDVLAPMTVEIVADCGKYPVLLSNGQLIEEHLLGDGRHMARWHDPHPKPAYLFALVAGALERRDHVHHWIDGARTAIQVYQQRGDLCADTSFTADSLSRAMAYDEREFGRHYDYPEFRIVALADSSTGGMENTSLNIFNHRLIATSPSHSVDDEFIDSEATIAHEYFHHWSGNRVTCRTWLELSLKEGLTVYREQCFSNVNLGGEIRRLADVERILREQFAEDAGPAVHAVRPSEALEINNLYTVTVYRKSAEIIRMAQLLLGAERFRSALDRYFSANAHRAVGWDELLDALQAETDEPLAGLAAWLDIPGTPRIDVATDEVGGRLRITIRRLNEFDAAAPSLRLIPLRMAIVTASGVRPIRSSEDDVIRLVRNDRSICIDMPQEPWALSVNRGFSAPVEIVQSASMDQLSLILRYEHDPLARLQALREILFRSIDSSNGDLRHDIVAVATASLERIMTTGSASPGLLAHMLALPTVQDFPNDGLLTEISERISLARKIKRVIAQALRPMISDIIARSCSPCLTPTAIADRRLRIAAMVLLPLSGESEWAPRLCAIADHGLTLTERLSALSVLLSNEGGGEARLDQFRKEATKSAILMDKWFALQGGIARIDTVDCVRRLWTHREFDWSNYNRARSLIGAFAKNEIALHRADGEGYRALFDAVLVIDETDPQLASLLVRPLLSWSSFGRQGLHVKEMLEAIDLSKLSRDLADLFAKALKPG